MFNLIGFDRRLIKSFVLKSCRREIAIKRLKSGVSPAAIKKNSTKGSNQHIHENETLSK